MSFPQHSPALSTPQTTRGPHGLFEDERLRTPLVNPHAASRAMLKVRNCKKKSAMLIVRNVKTSYSFWHTNIGCHSTHTHTSDCPTDFASVWKPGMQTQGRQQSSMLLMPIQLPGATRDFSPRVNFQCRLSYSVRTAPGSNCMH